MNKWQWNSVRNSLPMDDELVLWLYENGSIFYECIDKDWDDKYLGCFLKGNEFSGPITHWIKPVYPE